MTVPRRVWGWERRKIPLCNRGIAGARTPLQDLHTRPLTHRTQGKRP